MLMRKTKKHSGLSKGEKMTAAKMVLMDMLTLIVGAAILCFLYILIF